MWIDTHCHLDAAEFAGEEKAVAARSAQLNVGRIVIPAIAASNFASVASLARNIPNGTYALGIHPIMIPQASEADLALLRQAIEAALTDPRFVAVGEIGLDYFVPALREEPMCTRQEFFYAEQLKIARDFDLPVLLHVRRAQDAVLKHLRRIRPPGGIAHAFNGSLQQARAFLDFGCKLGFGGAMTFPRALRIRRLAAELPQDALVLETDAPDIAPVWLHPNRNSPEQLPRIGETLAGLRGMPIEAVARLTAQNACAALPRLAQFM